jgi:transcriptional regulator with XRE-family HTH domain
MMNGNEISFVGKRIKEIRLSKGLKLVEAAIKSSVSKGLLSRIENGRTIPSLPVLFNIINALDENPTTFFEQLNFSSDSPFYMLLKKGDYQPIEKEYSIGFHYFSIMSHSFKDITFSVVYLELEPQARREMVTTDGMEFIYLVEGDIDYKLGDTTITMNQGDSLFFDGRVSHLKINKSTQTARILVIYLLFNQ